MTKYADLAKNKEKNNENREITVKFVKMAAMNETLIGKLKSISLTRGRDSGKRYCQYLIETDNGLVKTAFGGAYDTEMLDLLFIGGVYKWTYKGSEKISNGHMLNRYETIELGFDEDFHPAGDFVRGLMTTSDI